MDINTFANHYLPLINPFGFDLKKINKSQRYLEFVNKRPEVVFKHLIFLKRSGIDFFLAGENGIITDIYNDLEGARKTRELYLFSADLRTFLNPVNKDGFSNHAMGNNNYYSHLNIQTEEETKKFADMIFREVFSQSVPTIMEQTGTLKKLDELLNPNPPIFDKDGDPKKRVHTSTLPDQLLIAVILAKTLDRKDFNQLLEFYSGFINKFQQGDCLEIDIIKTNYLDQN